MNLREVASLLLLLGCAAVPLHSQAPGRQVPPQPPPGPGEIRGTVVGAEDRAPLSAASVAVWTPDGSALVAGAIAARNGSFRIQGLQTGTYVLRVTIIGYAVLNSDPIPVTTTAPVANLGEITLTRQAVQLEGIEATAERPMTIAPDRNIYRAREVAPAATSASDVLEHVPSVQVDADGKVSLRGNENVVVQINGRPAPIQGAQLAGYLKALPAQTIERVEVIPNPSAKQDPEGMAGIINIVMRQGVDLGTSGTMTLSASTSSRYAASGNLGHQSGPLTLFLTYGYVTDEQDVTGITDRTRLGVGRVPLSFSEQDLTGELGNSGHNVSANVDYRLNPRDVLSSTLQLNRRGTSDLSTLAFTELSGTREVRDEYARVRDSETRSWMVDYLLSAKRTYTPQRHELSAEVRFNRNDDDDRIGLWRRALSPGGRIDAENNGVDALSSHLTLQTDHTRMLRERTKLETGYKGTLRWLDRDYVVERDPLGTGRFDRSDLSNSLVLDEGVHAVYAVASRSGSRVDLQAGLRAEYATRDFTLASAGETYPFTYRSLFPSGIVTYKPGDKSQLRLSYSRRIRRPGTQELNPFPVYFDLHNVFFGNPRLDPEYTDAIELSYQRSGQAGTVQVSPFFRRTSDVIRPSINTADELNGREITSITFRNLDHGNSWGADVNGQLRLGPAFRGLASFNLFKMVTDGGGASSLSSDAVNWTARVNGTLTIDPNTTLTASYFYRAPMNFEQGRFKRFSMANISARRRLNGDKAVLTVRVSDPFNTSRFGAEIGDDNLIQLTERAFRNRALHLSLQLSRGQQPRLRQRPQEEQPQSTTPFGQ